MSSLSGKNFLVTGVANSKSIAWAISKELVSEGANIALTYVNEAIEKRVRPLAEELGGVDVFPLDVASDESVEKLFAALSEKWGSMDGLVHSIAFAEREDLARSFSETSRSGFLKALEISAYSLIQLSKFASGLMTNGGSIVTLTYLGSEKVIPNYNVMGVAKAALEASVRYLAAELGEKGIRVNALSPGPIKTLAASGIRGFKEMLSAFANKCPMKRNVSAEEVASAAKFLLSKDSRGITGEVIYVDCGYNIMGM
ncbi:MAG: enoyl-ACP reductase [Candidatus Dadabacteria bacterium]|nr:MAG: enoyl-ACP reductase [Candidatus Dadabacteria bacterium]